MDRIEEKIGMITQALKNIDVSITDIKQDINKLYDSVEKLKITQNTIIVRLDEADKVRRDIREIQEKELNKKIAIFGLVISVIVVVLNAVLRLLGV